MLKSAACNINRGEEEHRLSVCLRGCTCMCWSGVLRRTWLGDFCSCHTRSFWGGAGPAVPKQSFSCSSVSSLTAGREAPAAFLLLWSVSSKLLLLESARIVLQTLLSSSWSELSNQLLSSNLWIRLRGGFYRVLVASNMSWLWWRSF